MTTYIRVALMISSATDTPRLVYCVCAPTGRVLAERMTMSGALRVAKRWEG